MLCQKCGQTIDNNALFCKKCGTPVQKINSNKKQINLNKNQKIIIVSLLSIITIMLGMILFLPDNNGKNTIMIYIVGSNLESDYGIVTKDLEAIDPQKIDLNKTNVLLYTGGTKKWHNFISSDDNGIYILEKDGFKKIESQKQYNLGNSETLSNFLKFGYDNYKASKYNLILYDHGGAIDGAIYDDISNDNLSLSDMNKALKDSPFNKNNKLDAVLFRTCLNGTIELANIFSPYANYLIGSEEISYGSSYTSVLNFINELKRQDNGRTFGIKFVDAYEKQMKDLMIFNDIIYTYSVIDLSKIDKVNKLLDEYISSINLTENYSKISKLRANLYQYGSEEPSYDMIDLYEFIMGTKEYASVDSKKLIDAINECVVYNNSNDASSHGLSIYFPYSGRKGAQYKYLNIYEELDYSKEYRNFINKYNTIKSSPSSYNFNIENNEIKKEDTTKRVSLQLDKEQLENYSYATFMLFQQDKEHPKYYQKLLTSDNITLSSDGLLTANYEKSLVKLLDTDDGKYHYIRTTYKKANNERTAIAMLYDYDRQYSDPYFTILSDVLADVYITNDKNNKPFVSSAKLISNNERIDGILLKLDDFDKYELWQGRFKVLDDDGNVIAGEWETTPVKYGFGGEMKELSKSLIYSDLDKGDDYYALFIINDIHDNISYSKLIKVGE